MGFGGKMNDGLGLAVEDKADHGRSVGDVGPNKAKAGLVLNICQVGQVARIAQLIYNDDLSLGLGQGIADKITPDKPRPTGYQYGLHARQPFCLLSLHPLKGGR